MITGKSTSPNFDNVGNLYFLKGQNSFVSFKLEYVTKNLVFLSEPYIMYKENKEMALYSRGGRYVYTNEVSKKINRPFNESGFRESLFFIHHNYIGFGISNMNHWLGPGVHNTLTMTNNTKGFPHIFLGTLNNKKIIDHLSINSRYMFSKMNNRGGGVYFTSLSVSIQFDKDIIYRFGFIRDFLSGGIVSNNGEKIKQKDAMELVFGPLFSDSKKQVKYTSNWGFEPWDQQLAVFFEIIPDKKTRFYVELGTGDHRKNLMDLKAHWDHNIAYVIGFKKYLKLPFYKSNTYLIGLEYATLTGNSNTRKLRGSGPWYDNWWYDYSSFDGRRWAAHTGSDSDDLIFYIGRKKNDTSLTIFYSQERKGLFLEQYPEIKKELLLRYTKLYYSNFKIVAYLEREVHHNYYFIQHKYKTDSAFRLELEYFFPIMN